MTFLVVSHAVHIKDQNELYAYGPLVREMNLWLAHVDKAIIVAPRHEGGKDEIFSRYNHGQVSLEKIPSISLTSIFQIVRTLFLSPLIVFTIFRAMRKADHIHLRCPGNIGLIGCLVQVLFPSKTKTAKYAGNWDPNAKQPLSYRFQKWLLSNTFLTKNMQVIVYGEWTGQSKNIRPFFTASYKASEISKLENNRFNTPFKFLFVGSLVEGKRPLYTILLVEELIKKGILCTLTFYGDGIKRAELETYVTENKLQKSIIFMGNQNADTVKSAYQESDFVMLPSKSEGWPKVIAEAMFWGAIPIATSISCVPWMLGFGERGVLLDLDIEKDKTGISKLLSNREALIEMSKKGTQWSQQYTLDLFESEIKKLL